MKIKLCKEITKRLQSLYINNPLQLWDRNKIYASLELIDPNKITKVKPMRHNEIDIKEFNQQIKELLDLKLIKSPKSPHGSSTFMVRIHNEIKMNDIFKNYDFIHVYIEDMLVSSKNKEQHLLHLNIFIDICEKHGIGLSKTKFLIGESKIDFLGLKMYSSIIELQPHILEKIHNFLEKIKDRKQLQIFLELVNYAERFIENLANLRKHFKKLISKK